MHSNLLVDPNVGSLFYRGADVGPSGYPGASKAHGGINVNPDETRITYLGYDGRIQGMYKSGSVWYHTWLDGYWNTGEFLSFDSSMPGHSSVISTGNLTAYYCGRDNHLRYFSYEPCQRISNNDDCETGNGDNNTLHRNSATTLAAQQSATESKTHPLTLFPNPTTGRMDVSLPASLGKGAMSYTVSSLLGQVVQQGTIAAGNTTIDLTACKAGVYMLQAREGRHVYRTKVVKY